MAHTNGQCSLFLYPMQHDFTIDDDSKLISALQGIGFISKKINTPSGFDRYFTGDNYLNYVSYMGCAPTIQFAASESNSTFCFIQIHRYDSAKLIHNKKQSRVPHCPRCSAAVKNWRNNSTSTTISCESCNTTSNTEQFDWRKMAGYARLFIEVTDIFPKEAIPQQSLLDELSDISNITWQYFYSCQ